jgi:hypothetical protein
VDHVVCLDVVLTKKKFAPLARIEAMVARPVAYYLTVFSSTILK